VLLNLDFAKKELLKKVKKDEKQITAVTHYMEIFLFVQKLQHVSPYSLSAFDLLVKNNSSGNLFFF
jgi:hypothetical protein